MTLYYMHRQTQIHSSMHTFTQTLTQSLVLFIKVDKPQRANDSPFAAQCPVIGGLMQITKMADLLIHLRHKLYLRKILF